MPSNTQGGTVRSALSALSHDFALRLWQMAAPPYGQQNACISPVNTYILLMMMIAGSQGQIKHDLMHLLGLTGATDSDLVDQFEKFRLDLFTVPDWMREGHFARWRQANALFHSVDLPVSENYSDMCSRWFGTQVHAVNFWHPDCVQAINHWVQEQTQSYIHEILSDPPGEAACLLANAVYFFDIWDQPFKFEESTYRPFFLADGMQRRVDTMRRDGMQKYLETESFQAVKLLHKDPRFCLYCFLPKPNVPVGSVLAFLSQTGWWRQFTEHNLELWLPRFTLSYGIRLRETLMHFGLISPFQPGKDFRRIAPVFWLNEIVQQAMLRVDEVGTQEKLTISGTMRGAVAPGPKKLVSFNRPFVFVLRHEFAATPLFIGMVSRPQ